MKSKFIENKYKICICLIIVLGCFLRLVCIDKFPVGLNCDEASSAYDAFSLLNYGVDRNNNSWPAYLEAWGSGQSVLYTILMIPFIKILDLSIISTRLPMALVGCISLILWYFLLKNINNNKKFCIIGLIFFAICPWHIMKSRWGLEANLFPDLILFSCYLIINFIRNKKNYFLYIAFAILGISAYSYGTAYLFLPFFCIGLLAYWLYRKEISIKNTIICFFIVFAISLPVILYVIINTFNLEEIKLLFITIPKLPVNRYEEQTSLFSGNLFVNLFSNFWAALKLFILQDDNLIWNSIPGFGMYYIISDIFVIVGIIFSFKKSKAKFEYEYIINIWFISAFLLALVFYEPNINRLNILIFPMIYYAIKGLYLVVNIQNIILNVLLILVYFVNFVCFEIAYVNSKEEEYWTFTNNVQDVIEYVDSLDVEKMYFQYAIKEPYIYVLFYSKYNTKDYIDTVQKKNENGSFENINAFGKYNFYLPETFENDNCVYVVSKDNNFEIDYDNFEIREFEKFLVLENKE